MDYENDGKWMYFKIVDGPVLKAIKTWESSVRDCQARATEIRQEIGASEDGIWRDQDHNIVGFSFEGEPPRGFKHYVKDPAGLFRPDKTKEGKQLRQRLAVLRPAGMEKIRSLLGRQMVCGPHNGRTGMALYNAHWKVYGKAFVAVVPLEKNKQYNPPEGLQPLTLSEHFALKQEGPS